MNIRDMATTGCHAETTVTEGRVSTVWIRCGSPQCPHRS